MLCAVSVVGVIKFFIRMMALENKYFRNSSQCIEKSSQDQMDGEEEGGNEKLRRLMQ